MSDLHLLASSLGVSERTLRRASARGLIHCDRRSQRRLDVPVEEAAYVTRRWPILRSLIGELRTLPNVRLAVLFGSLARGEEDARSDLDLLVQFAEPGLRAHQQLLARFDKVVERGVQIVESDDANSVLLADVLRDGRVLVDRDDSWRTLQAKAPTILAGARAERAALEHDAFASLDELIAEAGV